MGRALENAENYCLSGDVTRQISKSENEKIQGHNLMRMKFHKRFFSKIIIFRSDRFKYFN